MVKRGYGPVYRPDNFSFGRSKVDGDSIVQEVLIKGPTARTGRRSTSCCASRMAA